MSTAREPAEVPTRMRGEDICGRLPYFGRNELSRLVLTTLRIASDEPIDIEEISRRVIVARGLDASDEALRAAIWQVYALSHAVA